MEKWERTYDVYAAVLTHLVKKKLNSSGDIADIDQRGKHGKQSRIEESVIEDLKVVCRKIIKEYFTSWLRNISKRIDPCFSTNKRPGF